jgi:hypothetical protein
MHFPRMLVFIDESGDAGFKLERGSTGVFVVALCAFTSSAIAGVAARLRIAGEFKFNKTRHELRDAFFRAVLPTQFLVRAIVVEKRKIHSPYLRAEKEKFYSEAGSFREKCAALQPYLTPPACRLLPRHARTGLPRLGLR